MPLPSDREILLCGINRLGSLILLESANGEVVIVVTPSDIGDCREKLRPRSTITRIPRHDHFRSPFEA